MKRIMVTALAVPSLLFSHRARRRQRLAAGLGSAMSSKMEEDVWRDFRPS